VWYSSIIGLSSHPKGAPVCGTLLKASVVSSPP